MGIPKFTTRLPGNVERLFRQGKRRDEQHAEDGCLRQFVPPKPTHHERSWLLEEVNPSSKQKRHECNEGDPRQQPTLADERKRGCHDDLPHREGPPAPNFARLLSTRAV